MKLEIISRNYKVSDHLKNVLENKVEKFSRYFEDDAVMKISLKQIGKDKYGMEITVFFSGNNIVRSEVISDNMYNNIDLALPKIEGQIRKYRTKLGKKIKQSAIDEIPVPAAPEVPSDKIVRKKTFALHKMSVEEAVAEMEHSRYGMHKFLFPNLAALIRRADWSAIRREVLEHGDSSAPASLSASGD